VALVTGVACHQAAPAAAAAAAQGATGNPAAATGGQYAVGNLPPQQGTIRVPYIPQVVRDQIRDELRDEVLKQAKAQGWSPPGRLPPNGCIMGNTWFFADVLRSVTYCSLQEK
jgi:hypothetical protein